MRPASTSTIRCCWGRHKPLKVLLKADPKSGQPIEPMYAYVYEKGTSRFRAASCIRTTSAPHAKPAQPRCRAKSVKPTRTRARSSSSEPTSRSAPYIEDATATRGLGAGEPCSRRRETRTSSHAGAGKTLFVREGCWWCHTLLPEQTQDWQVFGAPPMLGDFNGESPTAFGSDRKAPDLLHVGSRNSSREWMMLHFWNPRLVQPHSIMPRFDYLWGEVDANGKKIDYAKWDEEFDAYREGKRDLPPDVPIYAANSEARWLIDFVLNMK